MEMRAGLGIRAHSGWAALVAAGGSVDTPRVWERRRIVIADPARAGSRQPYHFAAGLPFDQAGAVIRDAVQSSRGLAAEAISSALNSLRARGIEVSCCAVLVGGAKPLPSLDRILAAHPLIHTAEGVMFREAAAQGAADCGLAVIRVPEKELDPEALKRVESLGKLIGPPWTQDQKYAALAALTAASTASARRRAQV